MDAKLLNYSWQNLTEHSDCDYIDFSVNTNSLGIPDTVKENIGVLNDIVGIYPDPECRHLISCLAEKYNIPEEHILCGNGADDLLYRLAFTLRPKHAIIIEPTFEEYRRALDLVGCEVEHYLLSAEDDFTLDERILSVIQPNCDVLFLCNPNNPTGQIVSIPLLTKILERCEEHNVLLVVDECFMEFLPQWRDYSAKELTNRYANLIVIDAFTKTHSLAGFRLGFCVSSNTALLAGMYSAGQSFAVSTPAQFAGVCALKDDSYMQITHQFLPDEREWLTAELTKLPLKVYPSQGNFLLFRSSMEDIRQRLLEKGIKVRDCSQFYGLSSEFCRIAIRERNDNELLIKVLSSILLAK